MHIQDSDLNESWVHSPKAKYDPCYIDINTLNPFYKQECLPIQIYTMLLSGIQNPTLR